MAGEAADRRRVLVFFLQHGMVGDRVTAVAGQRQQVQVLKWFGREFCFPAIERDRFVGFEFRFHRSGVALQAQRIRVGVQAGWLLLVVTEGATHLCWSVHEFGCS